MVVEVLVNGHSLSLSIFSVMGSYIMCSVMITVRSKASSEIIKV